MDRNNNSVSWADECIRLGVLPAQQAEGAAVNIMCMRMAGNFAGRFSGHLQSMQQMAGETRRRWLGKAIRAGACSVRTVTGVLIPKPLQNHSWNPSLGALSCA